MKIGVEALFTSALGLQAPWVVDDVKLDTAKKRIDFEVSCQGALLSGPACGAALLRVHDRLCRWWRHLDFFQFEAWLHADVPRVACRDCGKTTQLEVPWARPGSGFTAAFEALALALCRQLPVRQAAQLLHCADKQLWRRIEFYVAQARAQESLAGVEIVEIDETSARRGQHYITVVHDLAAKRLLFATAGRSHQAVSDFAADLKAHGGDPAEVRHVCLDMSAAYTLGVTQALPNAQISYDRFHVVALALAAMDPVRRAELRDDAPAAAMTARRCGHCCGGCGATRRAGARGRPTRCTGCAALGAQERAGVALEDGAAGGVRPGAGAQLPRPGCGRSARLAELGAALSA